MAEIPDDLPDFEALTAWNKRVIDEFRANDGKVGGDFEGKNVLLLTHTGAKSGKERLSPLGYEMIDGKMIIIASKGGADTNPDWVHNLRANPRVQVVVGTEEYTVTARELDPKERDETFPKVVALSPQFGEYQSRTDRKIPLFELLRG